MTFYVLDENNNKVEAFDKEGVLSLLAQAISDGTLDNIMADSAFISKIKCCVSETTNNIAFVDQTTYNQLKADELLKMNTWYFITDDTTADDLDQSLKELDGRVYSLEVSVASNQASIGDHAQRIESLESNFTEGVANQARITNITASDVETQPNTATDISSMDSRYLDISDYMFFYWVGEDGKTYSFGLVKMPSKPGTLSETTYSYSPIINTFTYSDDVDGYGTKGYTVNNIQIEITCQRKASSQIGIYYYYTTRVFRYPMFDSSLGTDFKENFANGTLYWRPMR